MAEEHDRSMMDNLYWWGIPTLFRCPHEELCNQDIVLAGVPHSAGNGTTERDQHLGPRAVRNVSAVQRRVHGGFGLDPWNTAKISDIGDVPFPRANDNEDCIARITEFYQKIEEASARPVSIGGDHSITGGIVQALGGVNSQAANLFASCISMPIRTFSPRSTIFWEPRNPQPIGVPTWRTMARLIHTTQCRLVCAVTLVHWTGYSRLMTTATTL